MHKTKAIHYRCGLNQINVLPTDT